MWGPRKYLNTECRRFLVVQWLKIHLAMPGRLAQFLVREPEWAPCRDSGRGRGAQKEGRGQGPSEAGLGGALLSVAQSPQPVTEEELAAQRGCGSARVSSPGSVEAET